MIRRERHDCDGFIIFAHPYPTRASVRGRSCSIDTGVPESVFRVLRTQALTAFSVERLEALQIAENLRATLDRYAWLAPLTSADLVPDEPEAVTQHIELLQHLAATAHVRTRFAKALARYLLSAVALATSASLLASLTAPLVSHGALQTFAATAAAALLARFVVSEMLTHASPPKAHGSAAVVSLGAGVSAAALFVSAVLPATLTAAILYVSCTATSLLFLYWIADIHSLVFPDPKPPTDRMRTTPHVHWDGAIAPAWRPNRWLLPDSPDFANQQALWDAFQKLRESRLDRPGPYFAWAGIRMRLHSAYGGAILFGAPQAGKTKLLRTIMRGSIPYVPRSLIYDPKRLFYPVISALLPEHDIALAYCFDERARVWNIAGDVDTPERAATFAKACVPDQPDASGPYWAQSARGLLTAIIAWLNLVKPLQWTLRDLIAATDREYLPQILKATEQGTHEYEHHLTGPRQSGRPDSVIAALAGYLQPLQAIAAAHDYHVRNGRSFTLREWVTGRGPRCIIFSRDREHHAALDPLNQKLFDFAGMLLLDRDVSLSVPDTFIFLDELQEAEAFGSLQELLSNGRERGVSVVITSQTINALIARYGRERAHTIVDLCRNQAFLRLDSPETADLASKLAGIQHYVERTVTQGRTRTVTDGWSSSYQSFSHSGSVSVARSLSQHDVIKSEPLLLPSVLTNLPSPSPAYGLPGYFRQEDLHAFPLISPTWIDEHDARESAEPAFVPLSHESFGTFRRWTRAEFVLLMKDAARRNLGSLSTTGDDDPTEE